MKLRKSLAGSFAAAAALTGCLILADKTIANDVGSSPEVALGKKLYGQCASCHTIDSVGRSTMGPNLHGVYRSKAGTRADYAYSSALVKSGIVWNDKTLDAWLKSPSTLVPGNKMYYGGMSDQKSRSALIAYLKAN